MAEINYDKILAELEGLMESNPEGFTVQEMAKATGRSPHHCREKVRGLIDTGVVVFAGHRKVIAISGMAARVPVYAKVKK